MGQYSLHDIKPRPPIRDELGVILLATVTRMRKDGKPGAESSISQNRGLRCQA